MYSNYEDTNINKTENILRLLSLKNKYLRVNAGCVFTNIKEVC